LTLGTLYFRSEICYNSRMWRAKVLLFGIVALAAVLRLYQLGAIPLGLEWDEVALGYDAYSILHTGRDQFGTFLPNNFRSLDDWKPPLYVYSAVPAVAIFGLSEFATRLPAAVYGIVAVFLTYYLVRELFRLEYQRVALLSSFFLAISPWHLQFSRAAFETNLSVTVTIAAVLTFIRGVRGNNLLFLLSSALFGLALFSYHSTRVVTPLILLSLLIIFRRQIPAKKWLLGFMTIYTVCWIFFFPIATNRDAQIRFIVTNDLKVSENTKRATDEIIKDIELGEDQGLVGKLFHNRRFAIFTYDNVKTVIRHYLSHFSPEFLFVKGDAPLHHAPGFGMAYFFDAIFIPAGLLYYLFVLRKRGNAVLLLWMLFAPIPASVTWQAPHSVRSEIILPTLSIFAALGLYGIVKLLEIEWRVLTKVAILILVPIITWGVGSYLHQYYIHTNLELSKNWMYGRKEAVSYTQEHKDEYDKVWVSLNVDMPLNFWLFYSQYSPEQYLVEGGTHSGGFADEENKFDKYEFRNFDYHNLPYDQRLLLVGTSKDFPPDAKRVKTIYYLNGEEGIIIAEN